MELLWFAGAAGLVGLLLVVAFRRRGSAGASESKRAHDAAQEREPPVEIGTAYQFGVSEFSDHHSGSRVAVGKVEGFVLFAHDVPSAVGEGDVIRAKVTSFNRGHTSADATFVEPA